MTEKIKYISIFFILIIVYGCSNQSYRFRTQVKRSDLNIEKLLVGKWQRFDNFFRHFKDDSTFVDSIYASSDLQFFCPTGRSPSEPYSRNVCTEVDSNGFFLNRVVWGKYKVKDNILKLRPVDYLVDCNPSQAPASRGYPDQLIEFTGDTLQLTTFRTWQKTGNNKKDIWGSWQSSYWVWAYHEDLSPNGTPQLIQDTITFDKDSTNFHQKIEGLPYSGVLWRIAFIYDPPFLRIIPGDRRYFVIFDGNEMRWLHSEFTYNFVRL